MRSPSENYVGLAYYTAWKKDKEKDELPLVDQVIQCECGTVLARSSMRSWDGWDLYADKFSFPGDGSEPLLLCGCCRTIALSLKSVKPVRYN